MYFILIDYQSFMYLADKSPNTRFIKIRTPVLLRDLYKQKIAPEWFAGTIFYQLQVLKLCFACYQLKTDSASSTEIAPWD